jgi:hypothetical protein
MVAIPKSFVSETDTVRFTVSDTFVEYKVEDLEADAFPDPTLNGIEMWAIRSNMQISAKDIAKDYQLSVTVYKEDESIKDTTDPVTYSLALYLNERLYKNGIILAQNGSLDADRRDLYLATLAYGANAQEVLGGVAANKRADKLIYSNVTGEYKLYEPDSKNPPSATVAKDGNMVTFEKNEDGSYRANYETDAFTAGELYTFADGSPTVVILTSKAPATEGGEE